MEDNKKRIIKRAVIVCALLIFIIAVGFIMIKYEMEGEKQIPFKLNKIMIISTADGTLKDDNTITIHQCNDLYLSIEKDENSNSNSMIKNIYIENIKVLSKPTKGTVKFYKPSADSSLVYDNNENNLIEDSITYKGDIQTSLKALTISNQGGTISFRTSVEDIGELAVDQEADTKTISYNNDGTLLKKAEISISDIHYNMGFDVIIELTDGKMYKGYINETLPIEDTEKGGVKGVEKVDLKNIVFKRIKIK